MSEALVEAAFDGDMEEVQAQLDKGFHPESCDEHEQVCCHRHNWYSRAKRSSRMHRKLCRTLSRLNAPRTMPARSHACDWDSADCTFGGFLSGS